MFVFNPRRDLLDRESPKWCDEWTPALHCGVLVAGANAARYSLRRTRTWWQAIGAAQSGARQTGFVRRLTCLYDGFRLRAVNRKPATL